MPSASTTTPVESSSAGTALPGAARAVWLVALRELTDQMTSLRFLIIALLAIGLTPLAVYVGTRDYNNRLTDYDRLLAERQKVAGDQKGVYDRGELLPLRVVRPPEALSVVVRGLDGAIPAYWDFSALAEQIEPNTARQMGDVYTKIAGERAFSDPSAYDQNKLAIDQAVAPITVAAINKRRRLTGEIDNDAERREAHQNEVSGVLMALSPAATFARAGADLAGTGDALYAAWLEALRRQQSRLDSTLFSDPVIITFLSPSGNAAMSFSRRKVPTFSQLPAFVPPRRDAVAALARALPSLGLLIVYTGVFIVGSFVAFARYDVR